MMPKIRIAGDELRMLLKESFWKPMAVLMVLTGAFWLWVTASVIRALKGA